MKGPEITIEEMILEIEAELMDPEG